MVTDLTFFMVISSNNINLFSLVGELKDLRRQLYPERLPKAKPKLQKRSPLHYSDIANSWCVPFLGSDRSIMMRTQRAR